MTIIIKSYVIMIGAIIAIGTLLSSSQMATAVTTIEGSNLECPDGYHVEKLDEGIVQCFSNITCEEGEYLNWFDKCMNHAFCLDHQTILDCSPTVKIKPATLPIDCEANPEHPYCNGKRGQDGNVFCDLRDVQTSCWNNDDVPKDDPRAYCAESPETKDRCKIN